MFLRHRSIPLKTFTKLTLGQMNKRSGVTTKKRILDVASRVFSEYGYTGANMRRIASAANISISGLYLYFKNMLIRLTRKGTRYSDIIPQNLKLEDSLINLQTISDGGIVVLCQNSMTLKCFLSCTQKRASMQP